MLRGLSYAIRFLLVVALVMPALTPWFASDSQGIALADEGEVGEKEQVITEDAGEEEQVVTEEASVSEEADVADDDTDENINAVDDALDEATDDAQDADVSDDEDTMTEEEFYSEFHGTSFRYDDGELIQSQSPIRTFAVSSGVTWTEKNGVYYGSDGSTVSGASGIGVDVSKWQGSITWSKVKAAGIDFAIIRCGYGSSGKDEYFIANVKGCIENNIPFGIYLYSYAYNESTARQEAQYVLDLLEEAGLSPDDVDLPIYYDLENQNSNGKPAGLNSSGSYVTISNSTLATMAQTFCNAIEAEGYAAGVYANLNWWNNYLTSSTFDSYSRWVAQYNTTCTYTGDYDYWQRMSTGSVSGISGNVDINFSYNTFSTPKNLSATAAASGTKISWKSVFGATGYAVYRKISGGSSWTLIGTTTSTSYTDKTVLSAGKTYYYTVRAYRGDEETALANKYDSEYWTGYNSTGVDSRYLATPTLSSAVPTAKGVKVSWSSVSSASGYAIYRKKASASSWTLLTTTTSTSYTDTLSRTAGTTYQYTVRAYKGTKANATSNKYDAYYWSGYNTSGLSTRYIPTPTLKTATAAAAGTKITWSSVSTATGYAVYRRLEGGNWTLIGTTTSTSYTDKTALKAGKTYYYTVRAYKGNVSTAKSNKYSAYYWSYYTTGGLDSRYLATPTLSSAVPTAKGVKVSWSSVSSASGYAIYRKKASASSWTLLTTTTSTSYTDTLSRTAGTTYQYTVRAYKGTKANATSNKYDAYYWSGYNTSGLSTRYIPTPTLKTATAAAAGTKITWSSVSTATGYAVYRRLEGGNWTLIGTTTSTSYTDKTALKAGKTYYYTVRAYKGNVSTAKSNKYSAYYWSYYTTGGLDSRYLTTPTLKSVTKVSSGRKVSWGSVSGASGYAVYRKVAGASKWTLIGTTTSTSYTDKASLSSKKTYYYTVRAYKGTKAKATSNKYDAYYWSGYKTKGVSSTG